MTKDERIKTLEALAQEYNDYIDILVEELTETQSIALVHGWKSSLVQQGIRARDRLDELLNKLDLKIKRKSQHDPNIIQA